MKNSTKDITVPLPHQAEGHLDRLRTASIERLRQDIQAGLDSGPADELDIEEIKRRGRERLAAMKQG